MPRGNIGLRTLASCTTGARCKAVSDIAFDEKGTRGKSRIGGDAIDGGFHGKGERLRGKGKGY